MYGRGDASERKLVQYVKSEWQPLALDASFLPAIFVFTELNASATRRHRAPLVLRVAWDTCAQTVRPPGQPNRSKLTPPCEVADATVDSDCGEPESARVRSEESANCLLKLARLASRINALEDALLLEAGDDHPLLASDGRCETGCVLGPSVPTVETSSVDYRMDTGILLMRNERAQAFIGAQAAEASSFQRLLRITSKADDT